MRLIQNGKQLLIQFFIASHLPLQDIQDIITQRQFASKAELLAIVHQTAN